jgi:hypothetical protein
MPSIPPLTELTHVVKIVSVEMRFWKMSVPVQGFALGFRV